MFEKASRMKLRFETAKGIITVEDLWDLPLTSPRGLPNLDQLAIDLNRRVRENQTESFVVTNPRKDEALELKFDIVRHVISVRLAEQATAKELADRKAKKERLLEIIDRKQNQALEQAPLEELQKMVAEL